MKTGDGMPFHIKTILLFFYPSPQNINVYLCEGEMLLSFSKGFFLFLFLKEERNLGTGSEKV